MKQVAILLLLALTLNGCSSRSTSAAQTAANGTWQAILSGGIASASGLSFNTQFTVVSTSGGPLGIESFEFLTQGSCFPLSSGDTASGTMNLTVNSNNQVTGTFSYTVQGNGNTLALNGTVTGVDNVTTLTGAKITGTWTLAGTGACDDTVGGSFTMTQSGTT